MADDDLSAGRTDRGGDVMLGLHHHAFHHRLAANQQGSLRSEEKQGGNTSEQPHGGANGWKYIKLLSESEVTLSAFAFFTIEYLYCPPNRRRLMVTRVAKPVGTPFGAFPLRAHSSDDKDLLVDEARDVLGSYCFTDCTAQCCRHGKLPLRTAAEVAVVAGEQRAALERSGALAQNPDTTSSLSLEKPCPRLGKDFRCTIYADRPSICREYPLFVFGTRIVVAPDCRGAVAGLLDAHLARLKEKGYTIL